MSKKKYFKKTDEHKNYWCFKCNELLENENCSKCQQEAQKLESKTWCEKKRNGEECGQLTSISWRTASSSDGSKHLAQGQQLNHINEYQDHDQQCQNCEKDKFAKDFPWLDGTIVCDECWWDAIKKNPEQTQELEDMKNSTNAEEKRTYQKYLNLKKKMNKGNNDRERERERPIYCNTSLLRIFIQ